MTVRFCGNCNQNVEPKKSFSVGKFVGLFILGLILAFPFGMIITSMESQFGHIAAQQQDVELGRQLMVDMATYIGSFLFILS